MECGSSDGRDDSRYNHNSFVEISRMVAVQLPFSFGIESFDKVYGS